MNHFSLFCSTQRLLIYLVKKLLKVFVPIRILQTLIVINHFMDRGRHSHRGFMSIEKFSNLPLKFGYCDSQPEKAIEDFF